MNPHGRPELGGERTRMLLVAGGLAALLGLVVLRAAQLMIYDHQGLSERARRQHSATVRTVALRGGIVDRNEDVLAETVRAPSVFANPRLHPVPEDRRAALADALHVSRRVIDRRLDSGAGFVWLRRRATREQAERALALRVAGIGTIDEGRRVYPQGAIGAHVIGRAGADLHGLEGVELRYDRWMRGQESVREVERDGRGRRVFTDGVEGDDPAADAAPGASAVREGGASLVLTIDVGLQSLVESELARGVQDARADAGTAILIDPSSGAILAIANVPTFDPNVPAQKDDPGRRNRAVTDMVEPGSTMKAILVASALSEGVIRPEDKFFCENGKLGIGKWTIHDHERYGLLSVPEVIQVSSNIGASKIGSKLGRERYARSLSAFGFGRATSIDLPGEAPGIMRPVKEWAQIDLATASFGQGISVTPIQLASAFAAIASGGRLYRPYVVQRTSDPDGRVLFERDPDERELDARQVISPAAAREVTAMLERVVHEKHGTGSRARIPGFRVAGKTGTAQKVDPVTRRYSRERLSSFVGFAPAERPRLVLLVMMDNPRAATYGGLVAAPVFSAVMTRALQRLGVEPDPEALEAAPAPGGADRAAQTASASARGLQNAGDRQGRPGDGGRFSRDILAVSHVAGSRDGGVTPRWRSATLDLPAAFDGASSPVDGEVRTPSLIGLGLRAAFAEAARAGLTVEAHGSGIVRAQHPVEGSPRPSDQRVLIELEPPA